MTSNKRLPLPLARVIAFVALAGLVASWTGTARGTMPPQRCMAGWWVLADDHPTVIEGAPVSPYILLPLRFEAPSNGYPPPVEPKDVIEVEARDAEGTLVAGEVGFRSATTAPRISELAWVPRWRPLEPLGRDTTYTLRVRVPDAPDHEFYHACNYRDS